jgi:Phage capsid family
MFGNDPVTEYLLRAATGPAETGTTGWAQPLAGVAIYDLVATATSVSAGADIISRGLKTSLDHIAELRIPGRALSASQAGQWVPEGGAIPVRQLSFSNVTILRPRKLAVITVYTREMAENSNIEAILRQTLTEATGIAIDGQMLSTNAGDSSKPAGLFTGAPIAAATGGGVAAMMADLGALFGALAANGAGKSAVVVAAVPQAVGMKAMLGPQWDYPILASSQMAAGTVAVIEVASFVSGFSSTPEFSVSQIGALHMEDTAPTDITGGTPSPAVPIKSMFQVDALALRTELWASFGMRAVGHTAYLTGATW